MKNVNYQLTIDATPARVGMVTLDHQDCQWWFSPCFRCHNQYDISEDLRLDYLSYHKGYELQINSF